ncbi:MAG TPA: lysine--tRNA ligase [Pyrinomonadaceae bacterium]|nr:lysine--tRNA ligase [Pyrinomonadaceae bacterium]
MDRLDGLSYPYMIPQFDDIIEQNDQTAARREHLEKLRELVGNVYPNKFERSQVCGDEDTITKLLNFPAVKEISAEIGDVVSKLGHGERPPAEIKDALNARLKDLGNVRISGRLAVPPRVMGKAAFVHLSDGMSRLQIYVRKQDAVAISNDTREPIDQEGAAWELFGLLDHGDFIGVEGYLFITNTGEVSVHVEKLQFLAKAMLPMPDKMHGIADPEIRQRQRYADLIASSLQIEHEGLTTREVFETRAKVISSARRFLEDHGYIEVETPMLTPKATGAAAKPFETHHNALDITLYARIAPELYLKRLVVGGFEKVYELNRNFRNEGISYKHNPEFTMLEFYCAYMDVNGMMDFCETMLRQSVQNATGGLKVTYEGNEIDFSSFERLPMRDAIRKYAPEAEVDDSNIIDWFDNHVEANLIQPTFIIDYPKSISPLSKASPENPRVAERFELFINGMEVANGFSELNDPKEQYERFVDQMSERERGDEEAMVLDEDYIRALSYGMPPAAGIGIGIDRLVMLLTNKHSIRDVILFPHLRPERKNVEADE